MHLVLGEWERQPVAQPGQVLGPDLQQGSCNVADVPKLQASLGSHTHHSYAPSGTRPHAPRCRTQHSRPPHLPRQRWKTINPAYTRLALPSCSRPPCPYRMIFHRATNTSTPHWPHWTPLVPHTPDPSNPSGCRSPHKHQAHHATTTSTV